MNLTFKLISLKQNVGAVCSGMYNPTISREDIVKLKRFNFNLRLLIYGVSKKPNCAVFHMECSYRVLILISVNTKGLQIK